MATGGEKTMLNPGEREKLIEDHLPLVRYVVRTMSAGRRVAGLEFEDLVGHGCCGLIQAVDRYNPDQGGQFATFAITRIRGAVLDAMRALDPVGRPTRALAKQLDAAANALALQLGREPTAAEVQQATGVDEQRYWRVRGAAEMALIALDASADEDSTMCPQVAADEEEVSASLERNELRQALVDAVAALPERHKLLLSLYYVEGLTMRETAVAMGVSETRISQLLQQAYARLRGNKRLAEAA
jgi:RNA polymerase sigma factor for flagellar operon FliA